MVMIKVTNFGGVNNESVGGSVEKEGGVFVCFGVRNLSEIC